MNTGQIEVRFTKWKPSIGGYSATLQSHPPFLVTYYSGRAAQFRVTVTLQLSTADTMRLDRDEVAARVMNNGMQVVSVMLKKTIELGIRGYILKFRRNGRPQARPIKELSLSSIIQL